MNVHIKKLYNQNCVETGSVLSAIVGHPTTQPQKAQIEQQLIDYAFNVLYPGEGLNIFSDVNVDTPSIVAIKRINDIQGYDIVI